MQRNTRHRSHSNPLRWLLGLSVVAGLSACESTPAGPDSTTLTLEEAQIEFVVAQTDAAVQAEGRAGRRIPYLHILIRQTRQEIEAQGGHPQGEALLEEAKSLGEAARAAFQSGDTEGARALIEESHRTVLEAVVAVLGESVANDAVDAVGSLLANVQERLEGAEIPERAAEALANAAAEFAAAEAALQVGNAIEALDHAIRAAHRIDGLRDRIQLRRDRVRSAVETAAHLLRIATRVAGGEPPEGVATALDEAAELLAASRAAVRAGNGAEATDLARRSSHISIDLIRTLRGDDGGGM